MIVVSGAGASPLFTTTFGPIRDAACRLALRCCRQYHSAMNTATKLLVAMRRNALDWQLAQLQTVAKQHGIDWRHDGGSHCVFVRTDGKTLPVPARRPIKPIYVKKFIDLVDGA